MPIQFIKTKENGYGAQTFYILFDKFLYEGKTISAGFTYPAVSYKGRVGAKLLYEIFSYLKANPKEMQGFISKNLAAKEHFLREIHNKVSKKFSGLGLCSQVDYVHPDDIAEVVDDLKNYALERFDENA